MGKKNKNRKKNQVPFTDENIKAVEAKLVSQDVNKSTKETSGHSKNTLPSNVTEETDHHLAIDNTSDVASSIQDSKSELENTNTKEVADGPYEVIHRGRRGNREEKTQRNYGNSGTNGLYGVTQKDRRGNREEKILRNGIIEGDRRGNREEKIQPNLEFKKRYSKKVEDKENLKGNNEYQHGDAHGTEKPTGKTNLWSDSDNNSQCSATTDIDYNEEPYKSDEKSFLEGKDCSEKQYKSTNERTSKNERRNFSTNTNKDHDKRHKNVGRTNSRSPENKDDGWQTNEKREDHTRNAGESERYIGGNFSDRKDFRKSSNKTDDSDNTTTTRGDWRSYRPKENYSRSSERKDKDSEFDKFEAKFIDNVGKMEFKIVKEVEGDLFSAGDEYALGHCVAEDMNMGSGIAVTFRQMFKKVDELLNQRKSQGQLAVLEHKKRFIYYLVTKRESSGKPTYYSMWSSLHALKNHIQTNEVKKLALPRIGCGLDRLEWICIKNMLEYIFQGLDLEIKIFNFQQDISLPLPKPRKSGVVNEPYPITDIASGTVIVYFGSEDGVITKDIEDLSNKFVYIRHSYRGEQKQVGTYIRTDRHSLGFVFYGCIVRKCHTDPFDFTYFQKCLNALQKQNRKDQYEYIAFQPFKEEGDPLIASKIVNLMRNSLTDIDVYVCWPKDLQYKMPRSYNTN